MPLKDNVKRLGVLVACLCALPLFAGDVYREFSGFVETEARYFPFDALHDGQANGDISIAADPEWYVEWDGGNRQFIFHPFVRLDSQDVDRSHVDIREMYYLQTKGSLELGVGVRKVFWGVIETQHLVDVINQTDFVEGIDGEAKLGQPMLSLSYATPYGIFDGYLLLGFRERTFAGQRGRLRFPMPISQNADYEADNTDAHVDWAMRYANSVSYFDFGLSYFSGTNRFPFFNVRNNEFVPYYVQMQQLGLDAQATIGAWLWKLEALTQDNSVEDYFAYSAGLEYSFYTVFDTDADLGFLVEYHRDERGKDGPTPFDDDLFVGTRIALNDVQSSELLAGGMVDLESQSSFYSLEASRRFGDRIKLAIEARLLMNQPSTDLFYGFRRDDFIGITTEYYF